MKKKKSIAALLLAGTMLFSTLPMNVLAVESRAVAGGLCEHHTRHDADCGYMEGTPEITCRHEHTKDCYTHVTHCVHQHGEDCYPEETDSASDSKATLSNVQEREPEHCSHHCSEESGCSRKELNCLHKHDQSCGASSAAEGTPCGYICKVCRASDSSEENSSIGNSGTENNDTENSDTENSDTENSDTEKDNSETSNVELQKPVNVDDELELQTALDLEKYSAAATLIIGNVSTVETNPDLLGDGGSASYDADTYTLTLNDCRLPDGKIIFTDYQDETLTIELNGKNVIPYINVSSDKLSLRITGNGSLEMENKDSHAIISNHGDIEIRDGATITAFSDTDCGIFALGSIKISDSTVTAKGNLAGLRGDAGIVINDGSTVEADSVSECAIYSHSGSVEISGSATVTASSAANEKNGIYTPEGKITIDSSKVIADSYYPGLVGTQGVIITDGSDVTSVSSHDAAIYTPAAITISASKVNANGYYPSLFGNQGVAIADGSNVTAVSSNDCAIFSRAAVTISASKVNAEGYGVGLRGNGGVSIENSSKVTATATAPSEKAPSGIYSENDFVLNNSELYTESEHLGIFTQNKGTISGAWLQVNNGVWAENKDQYTIADSVIIESGKGVVNGDARLFQGANLRTGDEIDISQNTSLTVEAGGIKILGGTGGVTVGSNGELLLPPGTVLQKAGDAQGTEQIIGNGGGSISPDGRVEDWSSYQLTLSVPVFEDAEYGYTPKAKAITITNTGDSNATISDITISGSAFTINSGDKLVYTDRPNNTWTIQPKAGLNADTYTGMITVIYNGNATAAAEVKFTVKPLPVPTYPVTINGGKGSGIYSMGEKVTITAIVPEGSHFTGWTVDAGNVNLENSSNPTTLFTMPDQAVTITANWSDDSGSGDDSSEENSGGGSGSSGSGSGSSGGGSGSSSGSAGGGLPGSGSSVSNTNNTDAAAPDTFMISNTSPLTPGTDGNVMINDGELSAVIENAKQNIQENQTLNGLVVGVPIIPSAGQSAFNIILQNETKNRLVQEQVQRFEVKIDGMFSVGFDQDILQWLNIATGGADLHLRFAKTDSTVLSPQAAAAVGSRPVYDLTLLNAFGTMETPITSLDGHSISVRMLYTPAADERTGSLYAVYVDENGNVEWLTKSSYDTDQKAVIFETGHLSTYGVGYKTPVLAFTDIENHWAKNDIEFAASRDLLSGTGDAQFSPDLGMTWGMFADALGRLAGLDPAIHLQTLFMGTSMDTVITREEMAVLMANYAKTMGITLSVNHETAVFADDEQISSWAKAEVEAMQQAGVLAGKDGNLFEPQKVATRAEAAAVLRRFVEVVIDPQSAQGWVQNHSASWQYRKNNKAVTGWLYDSPNWYWLDGSGWMFNGGWQQIDGKWYYFFADGTMAVNTEIDGYRIGMDGAMAD